jgi:hypothetical protein
MRKLSSFDQIRAKISITEKKVRASKGIYWSSEDRLVEGLTSIDPKNQIKTSIKLNYHKSESSARVNFQKDRV